MALIGGFRTNSISDNRDFANQVTINLFKKRSNSKSNVRQSKISNCRKQVGASKITKTISTNAQSYQKNSSHISAVCAKTIVRNFTEIPNLLTLDQITNEVTVPFSNPVSENREFGKLETVSDGMGKEVTHYNSTSTASSEEAPSIGILNSPLSTEEASSKKKTSSPNDDLTPLSWLQSLDMGGVVPHLAAPPTPPASPPLSSIVTSSESKKQKEEDHHDKIDYSLDGSVKPPFSYAALIGMAMKENENKMTLSAIYKWIKEHYVYYKTADQSWQNSIRHNLSLNKCFLKVARSKDEPGKGGFWKLDPEYAESLVDGVFKKRRPSRTTAPPTTKIKRPKRHFSITQQQQIQEQVHKQRKLDQEELLRQQEQEEAVRSLLQPVQAAYMPPPTDKPPISTEVYLSPQDSTIERSLLGDESSNNQLKDDFVWSSFLGEETGHEDAWQLGSQEVVTDLTQSGDPSTYQVTASPIPSNIGSSSTIVLNGYNQAHLQSSVPQQHHIQNLPSFELSPASLGVEEDLFGTPEYSESSTDEGDSLISSFDLGVGLDLAVSTTPWENTSNLPCGIYNIVDPQKNYQEKQINIGDEELMMHWDNVNDLVEFHDFEGNLTQLTTLEPAAPVDLQQNHQNNWNQIQSIEEANNFSVLEANLDFDKLIDLDAI